MKNQALVFRTLAELALCIVLSAMPLTASALSDLANSMPPGSWAPLPTNGITEDMLYHQHDDGGLTYSLNGVWDTNNHVGYFWSGEHSYGYPCYYGVTTFTFSGTAAPGSAAFTNIPMDANTGPAGMSAYSTWDVSENGGVYTVTLNNPGGGFVDGDILTIYGNHLGGTSPANDLTLTVTLARVFNQPACADISERFLKYDANTNTWSEPLDSVTGKPHNGKAIQVGGHAYETLAFDAATGDVYKACSADNCLTRYDHLDHSWHDMATPPSLAQPSITGLAWYPEAGGIVMMGSNGPSGSQSILFWNKATNVWSTILTGLTFGYYNVVAIYNPVLHNMLVGSGFGQDFTADRTFYILTYNAGDGTWALSSPRTMPQITIPCSGAPTNPFMMDASGGVGHVTVDPTTGKYIVMTREGSACSPVMYQYDSQADTWTKPGGSHDPAIPGRFVVDGGGGGDTESAAIPEYKVIMYFRETADSAGAGYGDVWLYKSDGASGGTSDTTPPSIPTGLSATPVSSSQINLAWPPSIDDVGVAGYKVVRNGSPVTTVFNPGFQDTGLAPSTTNTYTVEAYDAAGNISAQSTSISATTSAAGSADNAQIYCNGLSASCTVPSGTNATISWQGNTGATNCTVALPGPGAIVGAGTSGTFSQTYTQATSYHLTCTGGSGNPTSTVSVVIGSGNGGPGDPNPQPSTPVTTGLTDLKAVKVYPNPWRSDQHTGGITFSNLPAGSTVKLFTASGHLLKTVDEQSGRASWDRTNDSSTKVASGIYLYLITAKNGQQLKGKVAVIR